MLTVCLPDFGEALERPRASSIGELDIGRVCSHHVNSRRSGADYIVTRTRFLVIYLPFISALLDGDEDDSNHDDDDRGHDRDCDGGVPPPLLLPAAPVVIGSVPPVGAGLHAAELFRVLVLLVLLALACVDALVSSGVVEYPPVREGCRAGPADAPVFAGLAGIDALLDHRVPTLSFSATIFSRGLQYYVLSDCHETQFEYRSWSGESGSPAANPIFRKFTILQQLSVLAMQRLSRCSNGRCAGVNICPSCSSPHERVKPERVFAILQFMSAKI